MLDPLTSGDDGGVADLIFHVFFDRLLSFLDQAFHRLTLHAARWQFQFLENLFEPRDLLLGFLQVVFQAFAQIFARNRLDHLGQRLGNQFFRRVEVLELVREEVLESLHLHERCSCNKCCFP